MSTHDDVKVLEKNCKELLKKDQIIHGVTNEQGKIIRQYLEQTLLLFWMRKN